MEFLSRNPDVVQVLDVFSDARVSEILASNSALTGTEHRIEHKLESLTGLQAQGQDGIELLTDLPGGHSDTHIDFVSLLF